MGKEKSELEKKFDNLFKKWDVPGIKQVILGYLAHYQLEGELEEEEFNRIKNKYNRMAGIAENTQYPIKTN